MVDRLDYMARPARIVLKPLYYTGWYLAACAAAVMAGGCLWLLGRILAG